MRKSLQVVLFILSLIPIIFAVLGVLSGTGYFMESGQYPANLDNQLRYLSGTYVLVSLILWWCIPQIEKTGSLLTLVCLALVCGGVGRLVSNFAVGPGDALQFAGLVLELGSPLILIWQRAVAKQYA